MDDGRHYKSLPETIKTPVAIKEIEAVFKPELEYFIDNDEYKSGHVINVSFDDPAEEKNYYYYYYYYYYYWNFKSFENITYCEVCHNGYYRNGLCEYHPPEFPTPDYFFTYLCDVDCWKIRYNEKIEILDDEFVNGSLVQIPAAEVLLYNKENILVELRQFSISKSAYNYYKVLNDVVENNNGFNAPPPAALVGNIYNVNNDEEYVLGRFTAASASKATVFINRSTVEGGTIDLIYADTPEYGPPPVLYASCNESYFTTAIKPEDWP